MPDYHKLEALESVTNFKSVTFREDLVKLAIKANDRDIQSHKRRQDNLIAQNEYEMLMKRAEEIEKLADALNISKDERNRMYDEAAQIRARAFKPSYNF